MIYVETKGSCQYVSKQQLAEEFSLSKSTIYLRMKELEEEVKAGRYGPYTILDDGMIVRINRLAFIDYIKYRQRLRQKNARKDVPPFDPAEIRREIGWRDKVVRKED